MSYDKEWNQGSIEEQEGHEGMACSGCGNGRGQPLSTSAILTSVARSTDLLHRQSSFPLSYTFLNNCNRFVIACWLNLLLTHEKSRAHEEGCHLIGSQTS